MGRPTKSHIHSTGYWVGDQLDPCPRVARPGEKVPPASMVLSRHRICRTEATSSVCTATVTNAGSRLRRQRPAHLCAANSSGSATN